MIGHGRGFACVVSIGCAWLFCQPSARAWIYPEHRQIGVEAWQLLDPDAQAFYGALWTRARDGYTPGLCAEPVAGDHAPASPSPELSPCIDFAAWAAIAADHACSPDELIDDVLPASWVHGVARVSSEVGRELADATDKEARENLWVKSNLRLQNVDDEYVTRAGANNAHFLLSLTSASLPQFIAASTRAGAPLNALGLYIQYHGAALRLMAILGRDPPGAQSALVRRALALEAYALHFLQDMFASGHVAGTWGDVAIRKGTHDYYCAHGYATTSWSGQNLVMYGDAHIRAADLQRAAAAVADSMRQLFDAARAAGVRDWNDADRAALASSGLDSCKGLVQPTPLPLSRDEATAIEGLLAQTPMPGHGPESVAWPRYHADFGGFLGIESGISLGGAFGGYGSGGRALAELGIGIRLGYALEGVIASLNSGTMFLHLGLVRQSEQVDYCDAECPEWLGSTTVPRVPSRAGFTLGLRMPFYLIPGDLIVLAPVLALTSPAALTNVAMRAASGGLIPWQKTIATSIGHLELVAGREVMATFFGMAERTRTLRPVEVSDGEAYAAVGFRAIALTFPILQYTPVRTFAQTLTASLIVQLSYSVEFPFDVYRYADDQPDVPDFGPAHLVLLRLSLTGRSYL
jgi:hypothetical protein